MSNINDSEEVEETDEHLTNNTITKFTVEVSHPLNMNIVEVAKRIAAGIETDKENITTMWIDSDVSLYTPTSQFD